MYISFTFLLFSFYIRFGWERGFLGKKRAQTTRDSRKAVQCRTREEHENRWKFFHTEHVLSGICYHSWIFPVQTVFLSWCGWCENQKEREGKHYEDPGWQETEGKTNGTIPLSDPSHSHYSHSPLRRSQIFTPSADVLVVRQLISPGGHVFKAFRDASLDSTNHTTLKAAFVDLRMLCWPAVLEPVMRTSVCLSYWFSLLIREMCC